MRALQAAKKEHSVGWSRSSTAHVTAKISGKQQMRAAAVRNKQATGRGRGATVQPRSTPPNCSRCMARGGMHRQHAWWVPKRHPLLTRGSSERCAASSCYRVRTAPPAELAWRAAGVGPGSEACKDTQSSGCGRKDDTAQGGSFDQEHLVSCKVCT